MECPSCHAENLEGARFCIRCGELLPADAPTPEQDPLLGQTIGGRYTIKRVLGEGGMGRVYEAERRIAGVVQRVAVKTLHAHLSADPQVVARFHRECGTVAQLHHPNTIKVEDFGSTPDGTLYIVMEFVDGRSVGQELEQNGPMPPDRVEHILGQVCGALSEAHKQGVIHRDLKPDNIVLMNVGDEVDFVKVLDFGIAARNESTDAAKEAKLTKQGMVLGTPPYMSPEQFTGKALDARSDIYSLGVMAYEMLTAKLPFHANTPWEWATQHMTAQPFSFEDTTTVSDIPGKMKAAIFKALSKNPNERQSTVREFFEQLSTGAARMRTSSVSSEHVSATGPTGMMPSLSEASSHGATGAFSPSKGQTEVGQAPVFAPAFNNPAVNPVMAAPPPAPAHTMTNQSSKGPLLALVGVLGIGSLAALVVGVRACSNRTSPDDSLSHALAAASSSVSPSGVTLPLTDTVASSPSVIIPTLTTHPAGHTAGTSITSPPTNLTGEAACQEANRRAGDGDVRGAVEVWKSCSGSSKNASKSTIAAAVPKAVERAAYTKKCSEAHAIAAAGALVGAMVDLSKYPECKGKLPLKS